MKRFAYVTLAGLTILAACVSGKDASKAGNSPTGPTITGTISGTVSIEGAGVAGVNVTLSGGASTTTATDGTYSFADVPAGAYTVTIDVSGHADASFSSTSRAATLSTDGQVVPVDFSGTYIRTASIFGSVLASSAGVAGVSVSATGPDGVSSAVSSSDGTYRFTGLRAGTYTVAISNIPDGYVFATISSSVTVDVGGSESALFVGTRGHDGSTPSASVVIKSVTTGATNIPVNPAAVVGQVDVTLQIDPSESTLSKVCVLLDGNVVANGCQTLTSAVSGRDSVPTASSIFEPTFSINTAAFDAATGAVQWKNGAHTLSARVDLANANEATVSTSMTLTTVNPDRILVTATPGGSQVVSGSHIIWHSGTVTATAIPVLFSGNTLSRATLSLFEIVGGAGGPPVPGAKAVTVSSSPYTVTWPTSGATTTTGNVGSASGPLYAAVTSSVYASGTQGPTAIGVPVGPAANYVLLDNVAPPAPGAWAIGTAGSNWWIGRNSSFYTVAPAAPSDFGAGWDGAGVGGGVGGVACNIRVGSAGETAQALLLDPAAGNVTAVGESATNTAYAAIVNCWDLLNNGNGTTGASTIMTNANPAGANTFGIDLTDPTNVVYCTGPGTPTAGCGAATPADRSILGNVAAPGGTGVYELSGQDGLSGPGDTYGTLTLLKPNGSTSCVSGGGVSCARASDGGAGFSTTATEGYWSFDGAFRDLAGNAVEAPDGGRMAIYDVTNPAVQNIVLPATLPNGGSASFSATGTDNLDLKDFTTRTIFGDVAGTQLPYSLAMMVTDASGSAETFGPPLTQTAQLSQNVAFIRSVEFTAAAPGPYVPLGAGQLCAGPAPNGQPCPATGENFTVDDWAGNTSTQFNNFASGTVTAGTSATALGVQDWRENFSDNPICYPTIAVPCAAGVPEATALTAVAGGMSGSFAAPFARVIFYRVDGAVYTYLGETTSRLSTDDGLGLAWAGVGTGREWTYSGVSYTATAADKGAGSVKMVAVGVDSQGDALVSVPFTLNVS